MNIMKNMEAIFTVVLALACSVSFVLGTESQQLAQTQASNAPEIVNRANVPVVYVRAKRMTQQEKLQSLNEERRIAGGRAPAANHM